MINPGFYTEMHVIFVMDIFTKMEDFETRAVILMFYAFFVRTQTMIYVSNVSWKRQHLR